MAPSASVPSLPADSAIVSALSRLAAFQGSFGAHEAVELGLDGEALAGTSSATAALRRLAKHGLLVGAERGRYRLAEGARATAVQDLAARPDRELIRERHHSIFRRFADQADREWRGPRQSAWLSLVDESENDLADATTWALEHRPEDALMIPSTLWFYWLLRGKATRGREWLDKALAANSKAAAARARALNEAGWLAYAVGDPTTGIAKLEASLDLARRLDDKRLTAYALTRLGVVQAASPATARPLIREALSIAQAVGDRVGTYFALHELAQLAYAESNYIEARRLHELALPLKREQGDRWHIGFSVYWLALLDRRDGRLSSAERRLLEGVRLRKELNDVRGIAMCIEVLSWLASDRRDDDRAVELLGAADAIRRSLGSSMAPAQQADHAVVQARLLHRLGESVCAERFGAAAQVTPTVAMALASRKPIGRR